MSVTRRLAVFVALLGIALNTPSEAEPAYVAPGTTNVRAGPGTSFPVLARVPGGTFVDVTGCISGLSWCDVIFDEAEGGLRGWISSRRLEFSHAGQLVPMWSFGTFFNVPIIGGSARYGHQPGNYRAAPLDEDCADPNVLCPHEGPVECEECPWPTGRAPE